MEENKPKKLTPKEEMKIHFRAFMHSAKDCIAERLGRFDPKAKEAVRKLRFDSDFAKAGLIGYVVGVVGTRRVLVKPLICATIFATMWQYAKIRI